MAVFSRQKRYALRACAAGLAALSLTLATACGEPPGEEGETEGGESAGLAEDRKSTRLNSSHTS